MNFGMNHWILLQIKSVCGVVGRDSMLVLMKDVIEVNYGIKVHEKWKRTHILVIFGGPVPVQVRAVPAQVVLCFFILTRVCILAITFLFLIRFE